MRAYAGLLIWCLASCASHDEARPSRARCVQLRDRIIELRLAGLPPRDVELHRQALRDSLGDGFVENCQQLTAAQARCAFAAQDSTSVAACARPE